MKKVLAIITGILIIMGLGLFAACDVIRLNCICDEGCDGVCNFELVIDVEDATLVQDEGNMFKVHIKLYNRSGQDIRIAYHPSRFLIGVLNNFPLNSIVTGSSRRRDYNHLIIPNNEYFHAVREISTKIRVPSDKGRIALPVGTHELWYRMSFIINFHNRSNLRILMMWSDIIQIITTEGDYKNV